MWKAENTVFPFLVLLTSHYSCFWVQQRAHETQKVLSKLQKKNTPLTSILQLCYVMNAAVIILASHLHLPALVLGGDKVSASRKALMIALSLWGFLRKLVSSSANVVWVQTFSPVRLLAAHAADRCGGRLLVPCLSEHKWTEINSGQVTRSWQGANSHCVVL